MNKGPTNYIRFVAKHPAVFRLLGVFAVLSLFVLYLIEDPIYIGKERIDYLASRIDRKAGEVFDGYLVYNPKCHLISRNILDPSILHFIKEEKFIECSSRPLLTRIEKNFDGNIYLVINPEESKRYLNLSCCYSHLYRPIGPYNQNYTRFDHTVRIRQCENFEDRVKLDVEIEIVLVKCFEKVSSHNNSLPKSNGSAKNEKFDKKREVYKNIHAIINPKKIEYRKIKSNNTTKRKLSVLVIGHDSLSRLNIHRSMPITTSYLDESGFLEFMGYNKVAVNTFPNLMAFLTGYNDSSARSICKIRTAFGVDDCPFAFFAFRNAGYVTGWAEEDAHHGSFTYGKKVGFVNPPVDYYFKPYFMATENFLKWNKYYDYMHCTGPESGFIRVIDLAYDFAKTFFNRTYFGLFWTSTMSHDSINGPSAVDYKFYVKLLELQKAGVFEKSMVILMSDHGLRFTNYRLTSMGWYEDRLPFLYIRLPQWFRDYYPETYEALIENQNKLISTYDLYETLRDVVIRAGGDAPPSSACPNCMSLLKPIPYVRGCSDAGIDNHWCACADSKKYNGHDKIVVEGADKFLEYVENIVKHYRKNGKRLCAKMRLNKIITVRQFKKKGRDSKGLELFYVIEVSPGGGKFEFTLGYDGDGKYLIQEEDISRIDSYRKGSMCLEEGKKQYCECN